MSSNLLDWQDEIWGVENSIDYLSNVLEAREISMADSKRTMAEIGLLINKLNGIKLMVKEATMGE
jgi:hypothetical protein